MALHGMPEIPIPLEVKPEFGPCFERVAERKRRLCADSPAAVNDLVQASIGPSEVLGEGASVDA